MTVLKTTTLFILSMLSACVLQAQECNTQKWTGVAKYHDVTDAITACGYNPAPGDTMYAALRDVDYQSGRYCNTCLRVSSAKGSVIVKVMDQSGSHGLDIHKKMFAKLGDTLKGNVNITWQITNCPETGKIGYFYSADSYFAEKKIMPVHSTTPIAKMFFRYQNNAFLEIKRANGNANDFFVMPWTADVNTGPYDYMLQDVYGKTITDTNIPYTPNTTYYGTKQLPACGVTTGLEKNTVTPIQVYFQNPVQASSHIHIAGTDNEKYHVTIQQTDGSIVKQTIVQGNTDTPVFQAVGQGIYIMTIQGNDGAVRHEKILVD